MINDLSIIFIADSRFMGYLPSVLATATMIHVVNSVEPCLGVEYQNQLLGILKINKVGFLSQISVLLLIKSLSISKWSYN